MLRECNGPSDGNPADGGNERKSIELPAVSTGAEPERGGGGMWTASVKEESGGDRLLLCVGMF